MSSKSVSGSELQSDCLCTSFTPSGSFLGCGLLFVVKGLSFGVNGAFFTFGTYCLNTSL